VNTLHKGDNDAADDDDESTEKGTCRIKKIGRHNKGK
jgi:hypothetical protein